MYEIPIEVPPGTAGLKPNLSLVYRSHGGNGTVGLGWSVSGLSAVSRCRKTVAQDGGWGDVGYDADDRYCLNGRRLVAVSGDYGADGTEYRTETDSFARVVSRGAAGSGPQWFEVWSRSGRKTEYGRTGDSRVEAAGRSDVRQWRVNRVTDTVGNYLTVSYREVDGNAYPERIDYTGYETSGAPYASVRFEYERRHDVQVAYVGGSRVRVDQRLTNVKTYYGERLVTNYWLTYSAEGLPQPSRVERVERCDGSGNCLSATQFTWNDVGDGALLEAQHSEVHTGSASGYSAEVGDFNGDGVSDVAWTQASSSGLEAYVSLGNGDGTMAAAQYSEVHTGSSSGYSAEVGDFNGDGVSDIAWTQASSSGLRAYVSLGNGDGTLAAAQHSEVRTGSSSGYAAEVGDFNGDGVSDVAWTKASSSGLSAYVSLGNGDGTLAVAQYSRVRTGDSAGYSAGVGDFNGDGLSDVVWTKADGSGMRAYVSLGNADGTLEAAQYGWVRTGTSSGYSAGVGDFNGDGVSDVVWTQASSSGLRAYASLGNGDGTFAAVLYSGVHTGSTSGYSAAVGDFNGDGMSDIAWTRASSSGLRAYVSLGNGNGRLAAARYSQAHTGSLSGFSARTGDFNGDGVSDMVWERATGSGLKARVSLAETLPGHGRVGWIASDFGAAYRLDYAPLTDSAVYTKDTGGYGCDLPCLDIQAPLHVVKEVGKDYGSGVVHRTTYRYGGAKGNVEGRGFLGFRWMEAKDEETGVFNSVEYRQDFPHIGRVSASSRFLSDGTALSTEENRWSEVLLNSGRTRFPYRSGRVAKTYELEDGPENEPVVTVTTASAYDTYGNPTSVTVTTTGAGGTFTKAATNTYANDAARWRLGRLTCASVATSAPGQSTRTRKSGFAYEAATGLLSKEVIEPRTGDVAGCVSSAAGTGITLITTYERDGYGNRTRTEVSGPGMAAQTTRTKWGERAGDGTVRLNGRFAVEAANALGHVEKRWHDDGHGVVLRLQGPNGAELETRWEHDGFGRRVKEVRADGTETRTAYLACSDSRAACPAAAVGRAEAVLGVRTQSTGAPTTVRYVDRRGLKVRTETEGFDGTAIYRDTRRDALGRAVQRSRPYFAGGTAQWTTITYDAIGRVKRESRPNGSRTDIYYDGLEDGKVRRRITVTPSAGAAQTRTREKDALGRLVKVTDPLNNSNRYTYDSVGNLLSTTDAANNVTTVTYDVRDRKTAMSDPDMGRWTYSLQRPGRADLPDRRQGTDGCAWFTICWGG